MLLFYFIILKKEGKKKRIFAKRRRMRLKRRKKLVNEGEGGLALLIPYSSQYGTANDKGIAAQDWHPGLAAYFQGPL